MELHLITIGAFLAISLLLYLTGRLLTWSGRNKLPKEEAVGSKRPLIFGIFTEGLAGVLPTSRKKREQLQHELHKAGYYHRKSLAEFLALRNGAIVAWAVFIGSAIVILLEPGRDWTKQILLGGGIVAIVLYSLPRLVLAAQASARVARIQHALPDALDMITMTITGGLPLQRSLERVSDEMTDAHPDLACELAIISRQSQAGSMEHALRQFAGRIDLPDVIALATLVRQTERLGTNVGSAFHEFADSIRQNRRHLAEERGNKASVKLLFPVVFCLAPPVYILLLGPAALEMRNFVTKEDSNGGVLTQSFDLDSVAAQPGTFRRQVPDGARQTVGPTTQVRID